MMKFYSTNQLDRKTNVVLWIIQGLLAIIFMFAGVTKLVLPIEAMTKDMPLPGLFLRFLGVAEVLGAIGLILPGFLRIRPGLAPLAAAGLSIITIGATVVTLKTGGGALAIIPLVVALLSAFVAYSRWRIPTRRESSRASVL
jgi:uncharacterized membrane protein YphA (DoxX/SURF4 family)